MMKKNTFARSVIAGTMLAVTMALAAASPAAANGGRPLESALLGANEAAPIVGDPDGSGFARITLNQGQGEVCFNIAVQNIGPVILAHIHRGAAGVNGPVVVDFNFAANGLNNCVSGVDAGLIKAIRQNPENYYVNVHTSDLPRGAVRGQLSK
jgi:hypothetical protein